MISPEAGRGGIAPEGLELSQWAGVAKAPERLKGYATIPGREALSPAVMPISLTPYGLQVQPLPDVVSFNAPPEIGSSAVDSSDAIGASAGVVQRSRVAIDGARGKWPVLRTAIDQLGYASTAFDSLSDLTHAIDAGRNFGLLLLALPADADVRWLLSIRKLTDAALLFVVDAEAAKAMERIGNEYTGQNNFDFVLAPFGLEEIKTRAQLLLSRSAISAPVMVDDDILVFQDYSFHCGERKVFHKEREVHLQAREYDIAIGLFRNMNRLVTRENMRAILWREPISMRSRALDVHVSKIRKKLNIRPENGLILTAVYRQGYQLRTMGPNEFGAE